MNKKLITVSRLMLGAAAALGLYLAWGTVNGGAPGCGESACGGVLASKYSRVLGVPVGLLGAVAYVLVLLSAGRLADNRPGLLEISGRVAALLTIAFAVWFVALQAGALGQFCALCCAAHALAVTGVLLIGWSAFRHEGGFRPRRFGVAAGVAAVLFIAGIGLQRGTEGGFAAPKVVESGAGLAKIGPASAIKEVSLYGQTVDIGALPVVGSRDAAAVAVALLDPTCKGCRLMQPMLGGLQSLYGDQLAIVLAPGARDAESEAIQRTLLSVWHCDPLEYSSMLSALTAGEISPSRTAVEAEATRRVGAQLKTTYREKRTEIDRAISFAKSLLAKNRSQSGQGALPQLMVGDTIVAGGHSSLRYYSNVIDRQLGLSEADHRTGVGPAIEIADGGVMHLGEIAPGAEHEFDVIVRNPGDAPLRIGWLNLPPGCSVKDSPTGGIDPDRGGAIRLVVRAPEKRGPWADSLEIHHNGGGSESLRLMAMVQPLDR